MMRKPWACSRCGKRFTTAEGAAHHVHDKHRGQGKAVLAPSRRADEKKEPSMAELAVQAEIDRACGIPNNDDWLLG